MTTETLKQLADQRCKACEGGVEKYTPAEAAEQLSQLRDWRLTDEGRRIRKDWQVKDFAAGLDFFTAVGDLAQSENHHPNLHLEGYRHAWIELSTHAVGGLSENDFIMAAKIDRLPVELRPG